MQQQQVESSKKSVYRSRSKSFTHKPVSWGIYILSIGFISFSPLLAGKVMDVKYTFWFGVVTALLVLLVTSVGALSCIRIIFLGTFSLLLSAMMFRLGVFLVKEGGLIAIVGIGDIAGILCLWAMPFFHNIRVLSMALENANRYVSLLVFKKEAL